MAPMPDDRPVLTIGHSPDPDDAFMWWPLGHAPAPGDADEPRAPAIDTGAFRYRALTDDIEALNRRAIERADIDATAISAHAYPHVKDRYAVTACGASMGDGYGPRIVAHEAHDLGWLTRPDVTIAIPGERTTAYLALRLMVGTNVRTRVVPFHDIIDEVLAGRADAGLVIHEGQLTYAAEGLALIADLGAWWKGETGLPLPLGLNAVRRDLDDRFGAGSMRGVAGVLHASVAFAMSQRERGIAYAMGFARGVTDAQADEFVRMYVNELTVDMGERGAEAVRALLGAGAAAGLCPDPGPVDVV
ncbi:MAG: ABC transporter substrate-binding protein [Phycisphaerales bacterium]|nr:MAG: ABC transporter substrate-binding protein [Phycisphaerales bacterium]